MRNVLLAGAALTGVFLFAGLALAEPIDPSLREDLAAAIRDRGYVCRTSEGGREWSHPNGGKLLQVYCNRNTVSYRVVLTAGQRVSCIEPWDDDGKKCK